MGANTFGTHFQISTFGESHGRALGVVIEGCPAGVPFSWKLLNQKMLLRRPGRFAWMSARKEPDKPELLSGVFEGKTLGTPLALIVRNQDQKEKDYDLIKNKSRTGHADDVWKQKFQHTDHRGGGRASGRETVSRVMGGAVAQMFVEQVAKIQVQGFPLQIGPFQNEDKDLSVISKKNWFGSQTKKIEQFLIKAKKKGESYGGTIKLVIKNVTAGLGQPVFRKLKSDFTAGFMSIGACYGVSLGEKEEEEEEVKQVPTPQTLGAKNQNTIDISLKEGSMFHTHNDSPVYGGIRGGISTGQDIVLTLKFKPPSSVKKIAQTGRHDPCIVPRAVSVVEATAWLILADHILWSRLDCVSSS